MKLKHTVIIIIFSFISCDPPRRYLLNGNKYYEEFNCLDNKILLYVMVSLNNDVSIIKLKSNKNINLKTLYINNNLKKFNFDNKNDLYHIFFKHKMIVNDTVKLEFEVDNCFFNKEILIGEPENFSIILRKVEN